MISLRVKTNGLVIILNGAKVLPYLFISSTTVCKNARIIRIKMKRLVIIFDGMIKLAEFAVCIPPIIVANCIIGIQLNRPGKIPKGVIELS